MLACQWHFDIPFGSQKEALEVLRRWSEAIGQSPDVPKARSERLMVGHIGPSPSHIVVETVVNSLTEWEQMMKDVGTGRYHEFSAKMQKFIVPGSQRWEIYRIA